MLIQCPILTWEECPENSQKKVRVKSVCTTVFIPGTREAVSCHQFIQREQKATEYQSLLVPALLARQTAFWFHAGEAGRAEKVKKSNRQQQLELPAETSGLLVPRMGPALKPLVH